MAIYTDSGITLFETTARDVSFTPTANLASGQVGNAVYIDGVPATGGGTMAIKSGRIAGYASIRDQDAVTIQTQYDELARGLVEAFAETDQSGGALPRMPGLFTYAGATGVPAQGVHVNGLAGILQVAAAVDPSQGGNALLLRDGGIAGAAYVYNAGNQPGFANRLIELGDSLTVTQTFSADTKVPTQSSLFAFADSSAGWLQEQRKVSSAELEFRNTIYSRASESLSQSAGVSLDQELAHMLELERSYQANSRLISVMDDMVRGLLEDVR
jgi:flagellar hook-associated protein 1 FlgK